jgi:hypothetical protein
MAGEGEVLPVVHPARVLTERPVKCASPETLSRLPSPTGKHCDGNGQPRDPER